MPTIDPVRIEGVADLVRSLRQLNADLPKALATAATRAAQVVVDKAQSGVPRRSGNAARSIQVKTAGPRAKVVSGGRRAPYFPWLDFGGRVGRKKSVKRPYLPDGRYVYPAYRSTRDQVENVLRESLTEAARDAGLDIG